MDEVGLRELRQNASDLVRRAERGDQIVVTVAGRPSVRLVRVETKTWRRWSDVADLFDGPGDPGWERDRDALDHRIVDPWARR